MERALPRSGQGRTLISENTHPRHRSIFSGGMYHTGQPMTCSLVQTIDLHSVMIVRQRLAQEGTGRGRCPDLLVEDLWN